MQAEPLHDLYGRFEDCESAYILGAAPNIIDELWRWPPRRENGFVFALNSSFRLYPNYDIHLLANKEFLGFYGDELTKKGIAISPKNYDATGYDEEFWYNPSRQQEDLALLQKQTNSLLAGKSALIPAMHFCLRCKPKKLYLYGIDLSGGRHWDDGEHENVSFNKFPGGRHILHHVNFLCTLFPDTKIYCHNERSLLVNKGVVEHYGKMRKQWVG